jgi:uncharacterized protein (DUF433 family)
MNAQLLKRITIEPGKCGGRPCIRGMRMRVTDVLQLLSAGASYEEILGDYPDLERDDILAAIEYAKTSPRPPGGKITIANGKLNVPDNPILPFIRGDGTGPGHLGLQPVRVFDAAVAKAYGGKRKISWFEVFAGEESFKRFNNWLPDDTVEAFKEYLVGIKGPLTTPVGGGIRSLNVALRQMLDLYVCLRPCSGSRASPRP